MSWTWLIAIPCISVALVFGVRAEHAEGQVAKRRTRIAIGAVMIMNLVLFSNMLAD